ncbi:uncharacterized protein LOC131164707 [Malania oleifera]|uniref:uncharacterized protein LOC131164707 n=1 Tax=Malania oleifera TaxID=397392 RepID=UPI0025ADDE84|nr:uncharacterized protein LOC131164707 [Malania oleifera]
MSSSPMASEERRDEPAKECVHKTKVIQFLGRTTPIILQNDNGPCPLLAICNVLLLKNNLNLSPDIAEVSQEKLLSLVAERLIDSNSNIDNKDVGYLENQQQNIADAIDLLPRLATGIDVNIKFRRIDDFEFTRECAIFDLLDIPLYHGWIVDPQDFDTADAIGSKSYNALMGELVALETQNMEDEHKNNLEEECIDFAAATTATLGVPSPSLSRGKSFEDSPRSDSDIQNFRKGDIEEEEELLRVLQLSKAERSTPDDDSLVVNSSEENVYVCTNESTSSKTATILDPVDTLVVHTSVENQIIQQHEPPTLDCNAFGNDTSDMPSSDMTSMEAVCSSSKTVDSNDIDHSTAESGEGSLSNDVVVEKKIDTFFQDEKHEKHTDTLEGEEQVQTQSSSTVDISEPAENRSACDIGESSILSGPNADSDSSSGRRQQVDAPETFSSSVEGSEPIYEGEECILDSGAPAYEDREPMYEGEVVLAKQADKGSIDTTSLSLKDEITPQEGELVRNFLRNNASQLTIYGLFCLQDGLKERELCVFFRNNHFSTMFKFDGELFLLATDQGYLNQPDLVWEKLNEVNGDTLFMTGNFKEFKVESHADGTWDEQNAMASTAGYLASIDNSAQAGSNFNSDLQLAIALQQQEFEQQPQRPIQQPSSSNSRLVTGPQVPKSSGSRTSASPAKQDGKTKDKCTVM